MAFKKNIAVTGLTFLLLKKDGTPITAVTTSGTYSLDGAAQVAITGPFTHLGGGQWKVNLTTGEMNGDVVGLLFTNTDADTVPVQYTIKTEATNPDVNIKSISGSSNAADYLEDFALNGYDPTNHRVYSDLVTIAGDIQSGADLKNFVDLCYDPDNERISEVVTVSGNVNGSVGSVDGAVASVTGSVGGDVQGDILGDIVATVSANIVYISGSNTAADKLEDFALQGYNSSDNTVRSDLRTISGAGQSMSDLKDFADTGYDPSTHKVQGVVLADTIAGTLQTLDALDTHLDSVHGSGSWGRDAGIGACTHTETVEDAESDPIQGCEVWVTTDEAGTNTIASGTTDSNGQVVFYLDAGSYYFFKQKSGFDFTNPETVTVS